MRTVTLGDGGPSIFPLVFGTLPLGPLQAGLSPGEGGRLIRHALERGVSMIDTAHLYGTYEHVREGLRGWTGEVTVASKTHASTAAEARAHVKEALGTMGRERLDLLHLHGARLADPFSERAEVFEEILKMRDEGLVNRVGLSSHYISAVHRASENPDIDVVHPLINRAGMGILDGSAEEMAAAVARVAASGKGVYAMKALGGGNFIAEARESLGYVLQLPGVLAVAVGMLSEEQIDANVALFDRGLAEDAVWEPLEQRRRRLKVMERFCAGCGACVEACTNDALEVRDGVATVDEEACILCGYCAAACPLFLIRVV